LSGQPSEKEIAACQQAGGKIYCGNGWCSCFCAITPTPDYQCVCQNDNTCHFSCPFDIYPEVAYADPIRCSLSSSLFPTLPTQDNKISWCRSTERTKGDADDNQKINNTDYYYYVSAVNGGKIPTSVNPDFNGDGEVGVADREIVVKTLNTQLTPTPQITVWQCRTDADCPQPLACDNIPPCEQGKPCSTCVAPVYRCIQNRCEEQDKLIRNLASEFFGASIRYQAIKGSFPWNTEMKALALSEETIKPFIDELINSGELNPEFKKNADSKYLNEILLTFDKNSNSTKVCFQPKDEFLKNDPNTKYDKYANLQLGCPILTQSGNRCYWCVK
jgi:hypothetical protein